MPHTSWSGKDQPLTVDNMAFLLERLGEDCHPLQFLRELTQNSIEAVQGAGVEGQILWDVDWLAFDLADHSGVYKLCLIDNGCGMSGEEQERYINRLSSSIREQSLEGNFGVGAKIAALPKNPEGLVYLSWKEGNGTMIHLRKNPDSGQYGLVQFERDDGSFGHHLDLEDDVKPEQIQDHGTKVILLGRSSDHSTMEPAEGIPSRSRWIAKYLNTRYFQIPEGIRILAREGWQYPREDTARNKLRTVTGQRKFLEDRKVSSGQVELDGACAHWWILEDTEALRQESNYYASSGHVAALHKNELYELAVSRAGVARLQQFGVVFGYRLVVIYVEPTGGPNRSITTNTARTQLQVNGEDLPWADWAAEFRENMPEEIQELIDEKASDRKHDHRDAIRNRLKPLLDLFRLSRFRPAPRGDVGLAEERVPGGIPSIQDRRKRKTGVKHGGEGGTVGSVYAAFQKQAGEKGERVETDPFPTVHWVTVANGLREPGDLEDRAARYLKDQNMLLINGDFRLVTDTVDYWVKAYGESTRAVVEEVVHEWIELALVESVLGVQALEGSSREWNADDISRAVSEEALTTAIQQRYHIHNAVKRALGTKLGKLAAVAS